MSEEEFWGCEFRDSVATEFLIIKIVYDEHIMKFYTVRAFNNHHRGERASLSAHTAGKTQHTLILRSTRTNFNATSCIYTIKCDVMQNRDSQVT